MATSPDYLPIPLPPKKRGARLRRLRRLAGFSQVELGEAMGYEGKARSSAPSKIESGGLGLDDVRGHKAINFLSGKGDLVQNVFILWRYVSGEGGTLNDCVRDDDSDGGNRSDGSSDQMS